MLTPEYLEHCTDDIIELTNKLEETIMRDIARRLVKNGGVTALAKWQIDTVKESGLLYEDIISQVSAFANTTEPYTKALFEDAGVTSVDFDNTIYKAAGLEPISLRKSPAAMQVLLAGLKKTNNLISNLTKTTANGAQRLYIEVAALAEMQIESGAFDYASAIKNAIRNAAKDSAFVVYPSGHRDRIDVAIRRAVLTGVGQTAAEISLSSADDMGCDLVETSAHVGARPDHAIWQGKIFSRSGKSKKYPDFVSFTGYGTGAGLCGWNCRHSFYPFFEGLSESAYPREQLAEYNSRTVTYNGEKMSYYDATQMQRSKERRVRSTKREIVGFDEAIKNGLKDAQIDFNNAAILLKRQEANLKDFLWQINLTKDGIRTQINGFGHSVAGKATALAQKHYKKWLKDINALDYAPKSLASYYHEKYNNTKSYQLLQGYARAVERGDISPLIGFSIYKQTSAAIQSSIVGQHTSTGIVIESFAPHFVSRVIGQVSTQHTGKRSGVSVADALDALQNPIGLGNIRNHSDGDVRQTFYGKNAIVVISIRDKKLIQTNPN